MQLESHMEERSERKSNLILKDRLVPFIQKMLGPDYSANLIMTVAGILETNCFEICLMSQNRELGGLFLLSLILSHDCIPNTKHFVNDDFQMTFQTTGWNIFLLMDFLARKHFFLPGINFLDNLLIFIFNTILLQFPLRREEC